MRKDEEATLKTLSAYRETIDRFIVRHAGRVFNTAGDSVVAEFGSAVEAVRCSITIQEDLARHNTVLPDGQKMNLRIGVNLGDVMVVGENLLGDGVDVAARLEGLANPGGICISRDVYNQVKHKLPVAFEDMGPQQVKNISEPVSAFRIVPGPVSAQALKVSKSDTAPRWRTLAISAAVFVGFALGAMALWRTVFPRVPVPQEVMAKSSSRIPEPRSIAVLPFKNLTGDESQVYFSEGVSETIITQLAKVSQMVVVPHVPHGSSPTYKDEHIEARQLGRDLGVRYILEGGVQRSGDRVRITAKLIEASTQNPLWAESYDRDVKDIFAVQDEITLNVVKALGVKLTQEEWAALSSRRGDLHDPSNLSEASREMMRKMHDLRQPTTEIAPDARDR